MKSINGLLKLAQDFETKSSDKKETIAAVPGIERTTPEFRKKLLQICNNLGTNADWIAAVMSNETKQTFSPQISGGKTPTTGAVGLIQFMPFTAAKLFGFKEPIEGKATQAEWKAWSKACKESRQKMSEMDAVSQLDYVEKFYSPYKGRLKSLEDVYMVAFLPDTVGKPSPIAAEKDSKNPYLASVYRSNPSFDPNKTGVILKSQVAASAQSALNAAKGKRISVNDDTIYDSRSQNIKK